jgi:hypothetical protein
VACLRERTADERQLPAPAPMESPRSEPKSELVFPIGELPVRPQSGPDLRFCRAVQRDGTFAELLLASRVTAPERNSWRALKGCDRVEYQATNITPRLGRPPKAYGATVPWRGTPKTCGTCTIRIRYGHGTLVSCVRTRPPLANTTSIAFCPGRHTVNVPICSAPLAIRVWP